MTIFITRSAFCPIGIGGSGDRAERHYIYLLTFISFHNEKTIAHTGSHQLDTDGKHSVREWTNDKRYDKFTR